MKAANLKNLQTNAISQPKLITTTPILYKDRTHIQIITSDTTTSTTYGPKAFFNLKCNLKIFNLI